MTDFRAPSAHPEESPEQLNPIAARMMLAAFPAHIREAFELFSMGNL